MAKDVIGDVIEREGGAKVTNDPADNGGRTQYGISEKAHPGAWTDGKVTEEEARAIYEQKYLVGTGIVKIQDTRLQSQMLDFCVNSGPGPAITKLQEILKVPVDGIIGPTTLAAITTSNSRDINNALAVSRLKMIGRIIVRNPSQSKFALGWISRACEFIF